MLSLLYPTINVNSVRVTIAIGAVLLAAQSLSAQAISGRVILDSTATPASRTVVVLISDSARVVAQTHADEQGVFAINSDRPGTYRLGFFFGTRNAQVSPAFTLDSGAYVEREYRIPAGIAALWDVWLPGEVTKPAIVRPAQPVPRYPGAKEAQAIRGIVRLLVVVNEKGEPEMQTVQVIGASDDDFIEPVLKALERSRFYPAVRDGRPVAQLVQRTVDFGCMGDPERGDIIIRIFSARCKDR